jgi:hypothetical protein
MHGRCAGVSCRAVQGSAVTAAIGGCSMSGRGAHTQVCSDVYCQDHAKWSVHAQRDGAPSRCPGGLAQLHPGNAPGRLRRRGGRVCGLWPPHLWREPRHAAVHTQLHALTHPACLRVAECMRMQGLPHFIHAVLCASCVLAVNLGVVTAPRAPRRAPCCGTCVPGCARPACCGGSSARGAL